MKNETKQYQILKDKLFSTAQELGDSTYKVISKLLDATKSMDTYFQITIQDILQEIYNKVFEIKSRVVFNNLSLNSELETIIRHIEKVATDYGVVVNISIKN